MQEISANQQSAQPIQQPLAQPTLQQQTPPGTPQAEFTPASMPSRGKRPLLFGLVIIAVILATIGYLIISGKQGKGTTIKEQKQYQTVSLLDIPFEIPADWYVEKRDGFESGTSKVLLANPQPVTVKSINDGISYRFNPMLIADYSGHVGSKLQSLDDYVVLETEALLEVEVSPIETGGVSPRVQAMKVTGKGSGEGGYASNQYVASYVVFVSPSEATQNGRMFVINVVSDSQDRLEEFSTVAEHSAETLIRSVSQADSP